MSESEILARAEVFVRGLMNEPDPLRLDVSCAAAGNAWQENLIRPVTEGPKDHGSDGSMQWRDSGAGTWDRRLSNLKEKFPSNWNTLEAQAQYFKWECKNNPRFARLWSILTNPGNRSLETLVYDICNMYEVPAEASANRAARVAYAQKIHDYLLPIIQPQPIPPQPIPQPGPYPMPPIPPQIIAAIVEGLLMAVLKLFQGAGQLPPGGLFPLPSQPPHGGPTPPFTPAPGAGSQDLLKPLLDGLTQGLGPFLTQAMQGMLPEIEKIIAQQLASINPTIPPK